MPKRSNAERVAEMGLRDEAARIVVEILDRLDAIEAEPASTDDAKKATSKR